MSKFTEISTLLDKAMDEVKVRKDAFDKATDSVNKASNDYQVAVSNAQVLRQSLSAELNMTLGDEFQNGVKVSG